MIHVSLITATSFDKDSDNSDTFGNLLYSATTCPVQKELPLYPKIIQAFHTELPF
jgi:hypothetical protein